MRWAAAAAAALAALCCLGPRWCAEDHHWSYHDQTEWKPPCNTGRRQSPINIESARAKRVPAAPLVFRHYARAALTAINNGHTVQFSVEQLAGGAGAGAGAGARPALSGGPLRREYALQQLHLHWLGEHAIDHVKYPLEIHLVHARSDLAPDQLLGHADGLAVVAVLCKLTTDSAEDGALQQLLEVVPALVNSSSQAALRELDLTRLLSPRLDSYYTYAGSLTTPGCQEAVKWIVLDTPVHVTDLQFQRLSTVRVGGISNFRRLQPLRGRVVYRAPGDASSALATKTSGLLASLAAALLAGSAGAGAAALAALRAALGVALDIKKQVLGVRELS